MIFIIVLLAFSKLALFGGVNVGVGRMEINPQIL